MTVRNGCVGVRSVLWSSLLVAAGWLEVARGGDEKFLRGALTNYLSLSLSLSLCMCVSNTHSHGCICMDDSGRPHHSRTTPQRYNGPYGSIGRTTSRPTGTTPFRPDHDDETTRLILDGAAASPASPSHSSRSIRILLVVSVTVLLLLLLPMVDHPYHLLHQNDDSIPLSSFTTTKVPLWGMRNKPSHATTTPSTAIGTDAIATTITTTANPMGSITVSTTVQNSTSGSTGSSINTPTTGSDTPITLQEVASHIVPRLLDQVLATAIITTATTTTSSLSSTTTPPSAASLPLLPPAQVYAWRKAVLQLRDALDIFGPIYPNQQFFAALQHYLSTAASSSSSTTTATSIIMMTKEDPWQYLRNCFAVGYERLGEYQDLDHANIQYTIQIQREYFQPVLHWYRGCWTRICQQEDIYRNYLQMTTMNRIIVNDTTATPDSSSTILSSSLSWSNPQFFAHSKESYLYWKHIHPRPLPQTNAQQSFQRLTYHQLQSALRYFHALRMWTVVTPEVILHNTTWHNTYHELRKQLRSILNVQDLVGSYIFTPGLINVTNNNNNNNGSSNGDHTVEEDSMQQHSEQIQTTWKVFTTARTYLGNLNDQVTAYLLYRSHQTHPELLETLQDDIIEKWTELLLWFDQVDFSGVITDLQSILLPAVRSFHSSATSPSVSTLAPSSSPTTSSTSSWPKMLQFLRQTKALHRHPRIVMGNQAGDADTIISAIVYAYVQTITTGIWYTPVIPISQSSLRHQRPEIETLFHLAGIRHPARWLVYLNHILRRSESHNVTLVDHNALMIPADSSSVASPPTWTVTAILDHHEDAGLYPEANPRLIAFGNGHPLVASCCTLVAEAARNVWIPLGRSYPAPMALLLLGVIVLDSVALSSAYTSVRDRTAVEDLLAHTHWSELAPHTQETLGMMRDGDNNNQQQPSISKLFEVLQKAKFDRRMWNSFSIQDALSYDFKVFDYQGGTAGVSFVLLPITEFVQKKHIHKEIGKFVVSHNLSLLVIMLAYLSSDGEGGEILHRQLAMYDTNVSRLKYMGDYFVQEDSLGLKPLHVKEMDHTWRTYEQDNIDFTRKQIGPLLVQSLNSYHDLKVDPQ